MTVNSFATWNVNSLRVRLPHVLEWLQTHEPDVLGIQETKVTDDLFPLEDFQALGYHVAFAGQKTYNGVAVVSKYPLKDIETDFPDFEDPSRRVLAATIENVRFVNVYVPNGAAVGTEKYAYKLDWLEHFQRYVEAQLASHEQVCVVGDFNIAPEDRDVHDPVAWEGSVLVSPPERDAWQAVLGLGLVDSFRAFESGEGHFSWWDYRAAGFRRNRGLRIDHVLVTPALMACAHACVIDTVPRKLERPSDHAPVLLQCLPEAQP